jgi:protein-S-isoprenylcysteine O-methyltransferase Ste14
LVGWIGKPGWIFVAFLVAAFGASALILARVNPSIYRARSFQPGTKRWDLVLVALIFSAMIIEVALATLDAGRMWWSSMPPAFVILGYALLGTGIALSAWAQAVNPFFEPGVRVQRERGQQVISKGLRHSSPPRLRRRDHDFRRPGAVARVLVGAHARGLG